MPGMKGKSGRKKTPTAILEKRGAWRAKTRRNTEPKTLPDFFIEPAEMTDLMKNYYEIYVPILKQSGILSGTDSAAFELMARTYCRIMKLREQLKDDRNILNLFEYAVDKFGHDRRVLKEMTKLEKDYTQMYFNMLREFGLTPASRAGVQKIEIDDLNGDSEKIT